MHTFKFKCWLINWKEEQNERSVCLAGLISRPLSRDVFDDHFFTFQVINLETALVILDGAHIFWSWSVSVY